MQRNAKVCKSAFLPEKCLSEAKLSTATYTLLAETKFLVKTKSINTYRSLPSSSSSSIAQQLCHLLGQGHTSAALSSAGVPATGQSPSLSLRGGRWLIKREITSATENHSQPFRRRMVKTRHQYGRQIKRCLPQQRYKFQSPVHAFDQNLCYFRMGLSNTTLKCLGNTVQKNTEQ